MRTLSLDSPEHGQYLSEIASHLRKSNRTLFVTGAGISCNAGIPDFRSKEGLYSIVKARFPDTVVRGQDLFDAILFRNEKTEQLFYAFMAALRTATLEARPTQMHHLIRSISEKGKLVRCYTQNIDGLEAKAGIDIRRYLVKLHGDLHMLRCMECRTLCDWTRESTDLLNEGEAPICTLCTEMAQLRKMAGKRSSSTKVGTLRPDIVLYGEDHPEGDAISQILMKDIRRKPQLLIITGTSLKVVGLRRLVKELAKAVHAQKGLVVFVNKTPASESQWSSHIDYQILCDTDAWVADLKCRIPAFFRIQTVLKLKPKQEPAPIESITGKNKRRRISPEKILDLGTVETFSDTHNRALPNPFTYSNHSIVKDDPDSSQNEDSSSSHSCEVSAFTENTIGLQPTQS